MKTVLQATVIIIIVAIVFSGCGHENNIQPISPEEDSQPIENNIDYKGFKHVGLNTQFPINTDGAKTEHGMYYVEDWPVWTYEYESNWVHRGSIVYLDYDSHKRSYLCSIPDCPHNNENCQAFVEFSRGVCLFTNANESLLFLLSEGALNGEIFDEEKDVGRLYSMNLDGTNRKEILKLNPSQSFSQSPVFANDEAVIFSIEEFNETTKTSSMVILKFEIKTGETERLYESDGVASFNAVLPNGDLIITTSDGQPKVNQPTRMEVLRIKPDGSKENVYTPSDTIPLVNDGKIIITDTEGETATITVVDLLSGESSSVTVQGISTRLPVFVFGLTDNKAHLRYYTTGGEETETHELLVDLRDGKVTEKKLRYESENGSNFISIVAKYESGYLISVGKTSLSKTYIDEDGVSTEVNGTELMYATIPFDDYWNNRPNYEFFNY